mmetsp:Transcript_6750/g.19979  ORF Transcript_6750/g.19979 Transcript_6750/m.19979 type:complete len:455 (+) Transcript_6750:502-1866(+)
MQGVQADAARVEVQGHAGGVQRHEAWQSPLLLLLFGRVFAGRLARVLRGRLPAHLARGAVAVERGERAGVGLLDPGPRGVWLGRRLRRGGRLPGGPVQQPEVPQADAPQELVVLAQVAVRIVDAERQGPADHVGEPVAEEPVIGQLRVRLPVGGERVHVPEVAGARFEHKPAAQGDGIALLRQHGLYHGGQVVGSIQVVVVKACYIFAHGQVSAHVPLETNGKVLFPAQLERHVEHAPILICLVHEERRRRLLKRLQDHELPLWPVLRVEGAPELLVERLPRLRRGADDGHAAARGDPGARGLQRPQAPRGHGRGVEAGPAGEEEAQLALVPRAGLLREGDLEAAWGVAAAVPRGHCLALELVRGDGATATAAGGSGHTAVQVETLRQQKPEAQAGAEEARTTRHAVEVVSIVGRLRQGLSAYAVTPKRGACLQVHRDSNEEMLSTRHVSNEKP